jgi:hypothetical protein
VNRSGVSFVERIMRSAIALFVVTISSAASAAPLEMTASTHGSFLDLTLKNTSGAPLELTTHIKAGNEHYDWLSVSLTGAATRTMRFIENRDKSAPVTEKLAAGASLTRSIDLAQWAILANNGDPLAPGAYDVLANWDTTTSSFTGPKVKLVATTKLVIPAAPEKSCTDKGAKTGVVLLAHQIGTTSTLEVGLHNIDKVTHCVAAYIKTHEIQNDWLVFDLHGASGKPRRIELDDARNKSFPVYVELAPGATAWTKWDVAAWALRKRNGAAAVSKGTVWLEAMYDASRESDAWSGKTGASIGVTFP